MIATTANTWRYVRERIIMAATQESRLETSTVWTDFARLKKA